MLKSLISCIIILMLIYVIAGERSFTIDYDNNCFLKNGEPFRYISAGIHYFRVPDTYWEDRLYKIRKAGFNAIQTYVAWNLHESFKGDYRFSHMADIVKFIKLAQKHKLLVVLRPGPYISAEWEFGGFPYWLLKNQTVKIRTSDKAYLQIVDEWMSVLLAKIKPLLYVNGGPVITVQVENEYGSYGCDHVYMKELETMFKKYLGEDVILFTTDGAGDRYLKCGAIPSLYTTVDFGAGGNPKNSFAVQRKYQPRGPLVNSEYYTGWLDHWGEPHQTRSAVLIAEYTDKILALNASLNMYMFEGGTNFGYSNGANEGGIFQPQPTSYDYDAPLTEAGDPTEKYFAIQKVLSKYVKIPPGPQPKPSDKAAYGRFNVFGFYSLFAVINMIVKPVNATDPLSFEEIDVAYGYVLYRTNLTVSKLYTSMKPLKLSKYHDRATVFIDQKMQGILDRNHNNSLEVEQGHVLDILVENQGRVNYGPYMTDTRKGILGDVLLNGHVLKNWQMFPVGNKPLYDKGSISPVSVKTLTTLKTNKNSWSSLPAIVRIIFDVTVAKDTFLKLDHWAKGSAYLNGFCLGRYWTPVGPQKTLYVPKNVLQEHKQNNLILFETDSTPTPDKAYVEFVDKPILG